MELRHTTRNNGSLVRLAPADCVCHRTEPSSAEAPFWSMATGRDTEALGKDINEILIISVERLLRICDNRNPSKTYYHAVEDSELFILDASVFHWQEKCSPELPRKELWFPSSNKDKSQALNALVHKLLIVLRRYRSIID